MWQLRRRLTAWSKSHVVHGIKIRAPLQHFPKRLVSVRGRLFPGRYRSIDETGRGTQASSVVAGFHCGWSASDGLFKVRCGRRGAWGRRVGGEGVRHWSGSGPRWITKCPLFAGGFCCFSHPAVLRLLAQLDIHPLSTPWRIPTVSLATSYPPPIHSLSNRYLTPIQPLSDQL